MFAYAGRVDQPEKDTVDVEDLFDGVAGRTGDLAHDGAVFIQQGIQEGGLSRIGFPYDGHSNAVPDNVAKTKRSQELSRLVLCLADEVIELGPVGKFHIFLG